MKLEDIISVLKNKIQYLNENKLSAVNSGDLSRLEALNHELSECSETLESLERMKHG